MSPAHFLLLMTILAFGAVGGLTTLRDQIVQEYGDAALVLENLNQSYEYEVVIDGNVFASASYTDTVGSLADIVDLDTNATIPGGSPGNIDPDLLDSVGNPPAGMSFVPGVPEGTALVLPPPGPNGLAPTPEGVPLP